ncbi:HlyD family efflux transporter periplasmic adaptor subunit [Singulisphaera acidiphila]|uniref:ABC exporter membrane fusion protein, DevB family n=1 Tax=Singulisphaera acidiphila (strain ATCC BAA-1392 / DSM 18658 / VKM B-2454 / MOB10) TaxID=886293 RepID=L0DJR1_SINAD|nr:HlyD family efflux transporter periplasmic adaptor subunit [Singulisphaera acidiphila]AGA29073.1 ABC exporter membrane fusion protein, DevB family [Singulisphaera acidiphila DSM 18658]
MKTILTSLVVGAICLVAGLFLGPQWRSGHGELTAFRAGDDFRGRGKAASDRDSPPRAQLHSVHALGRVEPTGGLYPVGAPAGTRVDRILVELGQEVQEGQELGAMDGYAERTGQVAWIEAQLAEARAQLKSEQDYAAILDQEAALEQESMLTLEGPERKTQETNIEVLAEKAKSSRNDYEHLVELNKEKRATISAQEIERQHLVVSQDEATLRNARAELERFAVNRKLRLAKLEIQLRKTKATALRASQAIPVKSLEKQLELAREQVRQTVIRAPRAGRILAIHAKPGEVAGPKPVFELGDTRRMEVVAEVDEDQVSSIRKNQKATIRLHAGSRPYTGVVESWALMVAKNDILGLDPTAAAYARVVEIRIRVDEPCDELRDRTHLQVNVDIALGDSADSGPTVETSQ